MNKVDRALEMRVIDWLQWSEWDEVPDKKHPAELALEMIKIRKEYCKALEQKLAVAVGALRKAHGALGYAFDDHADKFYSNSQDEINQAIAQIKERPSE